MQTLPVDQQWLQHYRPPSKSHWQGRLDGPRYHQAVTCHDLRIELVPEKNKKIIGIIGFASDEGVKRNGGRPGAEKGPESFRQSLGKFPYELTPHIHVYDFGDILCHKGDLETAQQYLGKTITLLQKEKIFPLVIGGGHEIAWGHYQAFKKLEDIAIINVDAHFDLRSVVDGKGNSGTSFTQIAEQRVNDGLPFNYYCFGIQRTGNSHQLFQKAQDLKVDVVYAEDFYRDEKRVGEVFNKVLSAHKNVYLTVCLDVFASPYVPGVSAPQALGVLPWHVIPLLEKAASSGNVVGFDVAELSPPLDVGGMTAQLAASLVDTFLRKLS